MDFELIPIFGKIIILIYNGPTSFQCFCVNKCCTNPDTWGDFFLFDVHSCNGEDNSIENCFVQDILNISGDFVRGSPMPGFFLNNVKLKKR